MAKKKPIVETFGQRLRRLRLAGGLTQLQVAHVAGRKSRQLVCQWESDEGAPRGAELTRLADAFAVSLDELIRGAR